MALEIAGPKFMGAAGDRVIDFMWHEERWGKDLEKVCLMDGGYRLNFPNISPSKITSLPNSISDLENLATLAKLMALRKLDLGWSRIKEITHGLEMLVNLRYLNLEGTKIREIPSGILSKLPQLQVLKFNCGKWNVEEIVSLKLECFKGPFYGVDDFNKYVGSLREGQLSHYQFRVREMTAKIDDDVFWESEGKCVMLCNCNKTFFLILTPSLFKALSSNIWIITEKEWWELLEWDNHATKNALEPLCDFDEVDPDDEEISMERADSHEEPPSNQQ
nr:putative disease resistance protein [Quercus suber]